MCAMHSKLASGLGPLNLASEELILPSAKFLQGLDSLNSESQTHFPSTESLWIVDPGKLASEHKNQMWNTELAKEDNIIWKIYIDIEYFQSTICNVNCLQAGKAIQTVHFFQSKLSTLFCYLTQKKFLSTYRLWIL